MPRLGGTYGTPEAGRRPRLVRTAQPAAALYGYICQHGRLHAVAEPRPADAFALRRAEQQVEGARQLDLVRLRVGVRAEAGFRVRVSSRWKALGSLTSSVSLLRSAGSLRNRCRGQAKLGGWCRGRAPERGYGRGWDYGRAGRGATTRRHRPAHRFQSPRPTSFSVSAV